MRQTICRDQDYAFGQLILTLRTTIGLTQAGLAQFLGVSRHAVTEWETGQTYPKPDRLKQLIALGLRHSAFAQGQEPDQIRALWRAARQKVLLDEGWLHEQLHQQPPSAEPIALRHVRHNLPRALTPCLGRAAEIAAITRFLADPGQRLVTIVGVGGVGKTRLALEAAWNVVENHAGGPFRDGVFLVPFADIDIVEESGTQGADLFASAIAAALHFALSGAEQPFQQVLGYLRRQRALLLFDNFEHLLHLAPSVVQLLEQAPSLTILATSSVRLDVRGEQIVALDGLPLSAPAATEGSAALQLFQHTASFHAPHLRWSSSELAAAEDICARVEGLPLAIELAASLARLLSPQEIAAELAANTAVLHTEQRDHVSRHRSLRAVFEHSWRLLPSREQRALARLSVFRGGFDRHAASTVAGAELASLATLIDHSLLRESPQFGAVTRYSLHGLLREYAAEMMGENGSDARATIAEKHSRYYLGWVATLLPDLRGERQLAAQAAIGREIENLRAAWQSAAARGDFALLADAGAALFHFFEMRSWFREGAEFFQIAASRCEPLATHGDAVVRAWAQLLARQGWMTFHLGEPSAARALLERSLALLEPLDAPQERAFPLNYLAAVAYHTGGYAEAEQLAHAAICASECGGDTDGMVTAKTILGQIAYLTGAYGEARRWSLESLALERALGNRWGTVFTLTCLGRVAVAQGAYADARRWFEEGLAIRDQMGDARGSGLCLTYLGDVASALGDYTEAEQRYAASLERFRLIHNSAGVAVALTKQGALALATQNRQLAQRLLHDALRTAWDVQALPAALDALVVLADALADDDPECVARMATLAVHHPATTQSSRRQAKQIWERLRPEQSTPVFSEPRGLAALIPQLLAP